MENFLSLMFWESLHNEKFRKESSKIDRRFIKYFLKKCIQKKREI
jgi:hypothetical protein